MMLSRDSDQSAACRLYARTYLYISASISLVVVWSSCFPPLSLSFSLFLGLLLLVGSRLPNYEVCTGLTARTALWVSHLQFINHQSHLLLIPIVLYQSVAEALANLPHVCRVKVGTSIDTLIWTHETHLQGERIYQVEFPPHHLAPTGLFRLLHRKAAVLEREHILVLLEKPIKFECYKSVLT